MLKTYIHLFSVLVELCLYVRQSPNWQLETEVGEQARARVAPTL